MAMKKSAKKLLIVCAVVYVLIVAMFVYKSATAPEPTFLDDLTEDISELGKKYRNYVRVRVDGKDVQGEIVSEADDSSVDVRMPDGSTRTFDRAQVAPLTREINEKLGKEISEKFLGRGEIIGVNYTLVMQWLNFVILLALLYGFAWDPLLKFLDQRREKIADDLKTAREGREKVDAKLEELQQERVEAQAKRRELRDEGKREGEEERKRIIAEARKEATKILDRARESINAETEAARKELSKYLAEVSVSAAERIVAHEISPEDHKQLIEDFLKELDTAPL